MLSLGGFMSNLIRRREFLKVTLVGGIGLRLGLYSGLAQGLDPKLVSPGGRSKVKVAKLYLVGNDLWPHPKIDIESEKNSYERFFREAVQDLKDIDFSITEIISSVEQILALKEKLLAMDGILLIQLKMGVWNILEEIFKINRPIIYFAIPYSGHEWARFGDLLRKKDAPCFDAILTNDKKELLAALRPFRALHHLKEAKILNVTLREPTPLYEAVEKKFGTQIKNIGLESVIDAYEKVSERDALREAQRWIRRARAVVEPSKEEIIRSCKLGLAFERLLEKEEATVIAVDCYGTMWDRTIKLPAYPCLGFSRLNSIGLGGICESDMRCALTHILFQGLVGRPGFISDPTIDEATNTIILAHCMGTAKMEGPNSRVLPYKIRSVMERQEGVTIQVFMPVGKPVTQAIFMDPNTILYFVGKIIEAPDINRGCRTKITVKVEGNVAKLWRNWTAGLHRSTCIGDITKDLERFARVARIQLVNELV